jgi:hypothetical protein
LLSCDEGLFKESAAVGRRRRVHLPSRAAQADERVAVSLDLVVYDRSDGWLRGVLPQHETDRLAVRGESFRPVPAGKANVSQVGVTAGGEVVIGSDQVLPDLEDAAE